MFSKDSARQADACRFCWMCRYICPVAGATGSEAWTPRARGLMISMIERGTEFDKDIAEAMYHCTLCDACANDCVTGYKPSEYTREARMRAVVEDLAPAAVIKMIDTISECGNIFGLSAMGKLFEKAGKLPEKAEVLLFIGQTAEAMRADTGVHAISILKKAGVDFTVLADEPASGAYLGELMGYTGDVQAVAAHTAKMIADTGAKTQRVETRQGDPGRAYLENELSRRRHPPLDRVYRCFCARCSQCRRKDDSGEVQAKCPDQPQDFLVYVQFDRHFRGHQAGHSVESVHPGTGSRRPPGGQLFERGLHSGSGPVHGKSGRG